MALNDEPLPLFAISENCLRHDTRAYGDTAMDTQLITWKCTLCGFEYDEAAGLPDEGFPAGTRWSDIPDSWSCPDCGYAKLDFEMVVAA